MKVHTKYAFLLSSLLSVLIANNLDFSGFYRSQFSGYLTKDPMFTDVNKFRSRLETKHTVVELDVFSYHGLARQISGKNYGLALNQAYAQFELNQSILTVGKQVILWGNGIFWNPTDILNTLPIFDPVVDFPGINALRIEIPTGDFSYFWCTVVPESMGSTSKYLMRNVVNFHETDFGTSLSYHGLKKQMVLANDIKGHLWGAGWWVEAAYFDLKETDYYTFLTGMDYTVNLGNGWYTGLEYFHDNSGSRQNNYNYLQILDGTRRTLARDYLMGMISTHLTLRASINLSAMINFSDNGVVLSPTFRFSLFPDSDFLFGGFFIFADQGDEFYPDLSEYSSILPEIFNDISGKSQVFLWVEVNF